MKKVILGTAALICGAVTFAQNNDSDVNQNGNANSAAVTQVGAANLSEITQEGGDSGENANHEATVNQSGTGNESFLVQIDDDNIAYINQAGDLNGSRCVPGRFFSSCECRSGLVSSIQHLLPNWEMRVQLNQIMLLI